jgi:hypothetical protein
MTEIVRSICLITSLVSFFFGSYYIFSSNTTTGLWAISVGLLLIFMKEFIEIDEYDDDEST